MFAEVMDCFRYRSVTVITIDGRTMIPGSEFDDFADKLIEIVAIEKEIKTSRANDVICEKRGEGVCLGRPRGSLKAENKKVLYGKTELLEQMFSTGLPRRDIAKELNVSYSTISNYLKGR